MTMSRRSQAAVGAMALGIVKTEGADMMACLARGVGRRRRRNVIKHDDRHLPLYGDMPRR